jgi:acetyl esterase
MNKLDPQVESLIFQIKAKVAQQPSASRTLSAAEQLAETRYMMGVFNELGMPFEPVSRVVDLDIPGPAGTIPARLYDPQTAAPLPGGTPILVFYHGGAFISGDLDSYDTLLRALANRAGCLVLSIGYRLAPENPYPAANDDAWAALSWVASHATAIGADPNRLAVGGDSAGGLLAAWVAQRAKEVRLTLRLQVLLYPILDATASSDSWAEFGTGVYLLSRLQMLGWFDAYLPKGIERSAPRVSPLFAIDLTGVAPALIVTADHDPLRDEGDAYADRLRRAKVSVDHTCLPGMIHGVASVAGAVDAGKVLIDRLAAALRKSLASPK